jgi:SAM-dependent methyltransferase
VRAPTQDPKHFKEAARERWDEAAPGWDAHGPEVRAWLARATEVMLAMAGVGPGARVIDVAAGAGDQTLDIARRVGARGHVLATDLSPALVARTRANVDREGHRNVVARVADGESLELGPEEGSFDAAVCRLGLMLFQDPLRGLREMHRALRPGGGACTMVFSRPDRNPCISILLATALEHAGRPAGDPLQPGGLFSLGKPGLVDALFREAGFRDVATTAVDAPFRLPSARHYLEFVRSSASPIQEILRGLDAAAARAAWAAMEERLGAFATTSGWEGPNELLLTAARR